MIRGIAVAIGCLLLGLVAAPNAPRADGIATLTAGSDTVNVGQVFTIPISVSDVAGLTSFQFDLGFDPTIITALGFTDLGTDFAMEASNEGGSLTGITGFTDDTDGMLYGVADSMSGNSGPGLMPGGVLVDIDFEALAVGMSPLTLENAFLNYLSPANGNFALQDGLVTVVAPEPGSLILLGSALGGLAALRRRRRRLKVRRGKRLRENESGAGSMPCVLRGLASRGASEPAPTQAGDDDPL